MSNPLQRATAEDLIAEHKEETRKRRKAAVDLANAIAANDGPAFKDAYFKVRAHNGMREFFKAVIRSGRAHNDMRQLFAEAWIEQGDGLRDDVNDDGLLIDGLRILLPAYDGPPIDLYRGESWFARCRRAYGLAWTADREVAEGFARDRAPRELGGSVVLHTIAPSNAIIFAPALTHNGFGESEYVVDRRRMGRVRVLNRLLPDMAERCSRG